MQELCVRFAEWICHFDVKIGTAVRSCQEEKAKYSKRLGYYYEYFGVL